MSKGSQQRPGAGYADGWDAIFGPKSEPLREGRAWTPRIPGERDKESFERFFPAAQMTPRTKK